MPTYPYFSIHVNPQWNAAYWKFQIVKLPANNYQANLWLYDEYDDYLAQWKIYRTSPIFPTYTDAKEFALNHWAGKNIEES